MNATQTTPQRDFDWGYALTLAIAGRLTTRRYRRDYVGKRRTQRNAPGDYLLSPAAYQLVTGTREHVHADIDQPTGLLRLRDIHPTGAFTTLPADNTVNTGGAS